MLQVDMVQVKRIIWFYEQRVYYQHSYLVLETELSDFEKTHRETLGLKASQAKKYYVTEKNDLGVIWNVFYDWESARNLKTEHDGYQWRRDGV